MNILFMNLLGRLQGYNRVRVMLSDTERFFNSLAKYNIGIWDVKEEDGRIFFNVRGEDMPSLYNIAEIFRTSVVIEKNVSAMSVLSFVKRYKYRIVLSVCAFLLIICISSYIWEVNIYGVALTDEEELRTFIYENGYKSSMSKSELDKSELELLIKTNFPYITSVVSEINGISLDITVYESEAPILSYDKDIPVDIVAVKDCIIDEIIVFNGTAKAEKGDSVKKGDILISGRVEYTYREEPGIKNIHATGKTLSYEKVFYDNIYVDMYATNENAPYLSEKNVYFMGRTFSWSDIEGDVADYFACEQKNLQISIGWLNLPILYDETRWYNTIDCRIRSEQEIYEDVYDAVQKMLPAGFTLRSMSYVTKQTEGGRLNVSVEADCAVNIGAEKEIIE